MIRLAFLAVAGFFAWRNRFQIQSFLESYGVKTPTLDSSLTETVRSGAAKLTGKVDNEIRKTENDVRRAV